MKPTTTLRPFSTPAGRFTPAALLALSLAACATAPDPSPPLSPPRAREAIGFASTSGSVARVTRVTGADGSETLHGETELVLNASSQRCLVEDVTLDAGGRLLRADVTVAASCDGVPSFRAHLDPSRGIARVTTESGVVELSPGAPPGASWIYTSEALPGCTATTPVAVWVATRAAARSPWLTHVDLAKRQAQRVPRDQVVVPTELGTTVVLGGDGAEVGVDFVRRLRLAEYGVTLVRTPRDGEPAI